APNPVVGAAPTSRSAKPARVALKKVAILKSKLPPKEIAISAATILFLVIAFVGFEIVHSRKSTPVAAPPQNTTAATLPVQANNQANDQANDQVSDAPSLLNEKDAPEDIAPTIRRTQRRPKAKVAARAKTRIVAKSIPQTSPGTITPPTIAMKSDGTIKAPATLQNVKAITSPPASATLELKIEFQFAEAEASVWLDNQLIYSQKLYGESKKRALVFKKVEGREQNTLKIPSGQHRINVRIQSDTGQYDQSQSVSGNFAASSKSTLAITCDKHGHDHELQLTLQ
ncbi:MAG: hypothetical protein ACRD2S_06185, partial [Terriglobales bacterium]